MEQREQLEYGKKIFPKSPKEMGLVRVILKGGICFHVLPCSGSDNLFDRENSKVYFQTMDPGYAFREVIGPETVLNKIFDEYEQNLKLEQG
jgi:hypothetical protein